MNKELDGLCAALGRALEQSEQQRLLVGYSGGLDSTAVLLTAREFAGRAGYPLEVIALHVDHGLHAESTAWRRHCEQIAAQLDVEIRTYQGSVAREGNLEANARAVRYGFFVDQLRYGDVLLLGHHRHDQDETVLQRLFSGRGVLPMRARAMLGAGVLLRPFLAVEPEELRRVVELAGVGWIEDPSNTETEFDRNYLRHGVLPGLRKRWPGLSAAFERLAERDLGLTEALLHAVSGLPDVVSENQLPERKAARRAWLRAYLNVRGEYDVSDRALDQFGQKASDEARVLSTGAGTLRRYAGMLYFESTASRKLAASIEPGEAVELSYGRLSVTAVTPGAAMSVPAQNTYEIRYREGGERVKTSEGTRTLKQIFQENRVPPWQRDVYPLIYIQGELVCVPELAVAQFDTADFSDGACIVSFTPL